MTVGVERQDDSVNGLELAGVGLLLELKIVVVDPGIVGQRLATVESDDELHVQPVGCCKCIENVLYEFVDAGCADHRQPDRHGFPAKHLFGLGSVDALDR